VKTKTEDELVMLAEGGPVCVMAIYSRQCLIQAVRSGVRTACSTSSIH
jgi:hypothetical protein